MANKKLRGVLLDVANKKVEAIEIADDLEKYYEILNCTCIDIIQRRIGRKKIRSRLYLETLRKTCDKKLSGSLPDADTV